MLEHNDRYASGTMISGERKHAFASAIAARQSIFAPLSKYECYTPRPGPSRTDSGISYTSTNTDSSLKDPKHVNPMEWKIVTVDSEDDVEDDDWMHNLDPKNDKKYDRGTIFTCRGLLNIGCLTILLLCFLTLFLGYPVYTYYTDEHQSTNGAFNLGGINSTGQIPYIENFVMVIDKDTPESAYTRTGFDGEAYSLVFSDEFEKEGRTFFPGDDPFWTGVDLHYWPTGDLEWYDPSAVTTRDGKLVITMTQEPIHDLNFKSGMIQSWNQICFQYSVYIEVSLSLPGNDKVVGFWPGVWMMGNLGRPGYGATTDGTWPYSYDSCDFGTLANQTNPEGTGPKAALTSGTDGGPISYLPGQRMSACTCKGEDHAGPDVSYGRGVPEIDVLEATVDLTVKRGAVSQSAQMAPFDEGYQYDNSSKGGIIYDTKNTQYNAYLGSIYQEAVSSLTYIDHENYVGTSGGFGVYGFEYFSNPEDRGSGHITWVANGKKSWTMFPDAVGAVESMDIGQRLISEEPMAMIINFGMSESFQPVDFNHLITPMEMLVDYVRVYQRSEGRVGCDPKDRPTAAYIENHINAYSNPNLTTWEAAGYTMPKNSLIDTC
ncbi:glucosidase [Cryptococcus neoformans C23]|uniref:Glucosidase n=2 Tax=Cryptococcus neoformans TaxID=5207 RepID=J9VSF5_CRYN9|nr:glucosidase [Cryptococcus neoformans var. grubii H99]XP_012049581.1 glucosidase, variant 1 [Cryptococcus neoformans var. grubii H99]XP_012049582.1 glucosidase, variant 2 [Cryptococcus neoformans var. grubii H99]AUB24334.1 glucosidase [Cryptococcus neoformans var. grubii]OWZ32105.1 glucosidase [Cryptococcus neoformans var. grubii AD2-60a]OWZ44773.1 glucosidase [Cryptococcus neoformans var. grubii C23]OXC85232.1 glucosidase [Cryptococcus neoformans var. grubii AD1-7a]OXG22824.1 glucosidase |eukprot:XP_012049580.1 glucosidase [Cryptococcus neoformans var. grubii H99]